VMIAERGVERDARVEQRLVRLRELLVEVRRTLPTVDVVAEHNRHVERELRAEPGHLVGDVKLLAIAGAAVAHGHELQRSRSVGKGELLRRHAPQCGGDEETDCQKSSRALAAHLETWLYTLACQLRPDRPV